MDPNSAPPPILLLTATPVENDDLNATLAEIADRKLKVDVVTFSNVESPKLMTLTKFGAIYASKTFSVWRSFLSLVNKLTSLFMTVGQNKLERSYAASYLRIGAYPFF